MPSLSERSPAQLKRVLVVEDESLLALLMAEHIVELGYLAVGPACTISEARHLATAASFECALLDLNLNGVISHEIADILSRRQIPFMFVTGYTKPPVGIYDNVPVLHKPFQLDDLRYAVEGMLVKPSVRYAGDGLRPLADQTDTATENGVQKHHERSPQGVYRAPT
jgi:CheY-like chemotaxis protein